MFILTHLHFDHAGGGNREAGRLLGADLWPARYWVQRENLEHARNPNRTRPGKATSRRTSSLWQGRASSRPWKGSRRSCPESR